MKDALKRSEEKFHSLFRNMSEGFAYHKIVLDEEGQPCDYVFLEINDSFERLTGLKGKDIIGKKVTEVLPGIEKDLTGWIEKFGKVAMTGQSLQFESYAQPLKKWYAVSAFSPHKGYFAVTFSDVTERKKYEDELIRSRREWELTFNSVPDMIAILDKEHRIVRVNSAMAKQFGLKPEECVGLPCYKYVHGISEPPSFCPHTRTMKDGCQHVFEVFEKSLGGDMLVSTTPIFNEQGEITSSVHVARNISELKQAERALRRTLEELQQRETEVTALLEASRSVMEQRDFKETARLIFASCKKLIGATAGYVALLSSDGHENEVLFLDAGGLPCSVDPSLPMPVRGLRGMAYDSGRTVYENDFPGSKWVKFIPEGHAALSNVMFAPLIISGETVGILGLANKKDGFTDNDARMASAFGELASIALYNSRLFESLRESEQRLNRSQEIACLGSWELDLVNNRLYWSDEVYRIFGLKPQEFAATYDAFLEAVHPDDRAAVDAAYSESLREGRDTYEIVHRVVRKGTAEVRTVHEKCEHFRDESGSIVRSVGMVHDITEQKESEEALRAAYARYRSFIAVTGQIGWTTDPAGEVREDLPEWRNYTGQNIDEIKGWGWSKALHPDDLAYTAKEWEKSVREKSNYEVEYRIRRHDGVYRYFLARGTPVINEDGTIIEWVGICIDITERRKLEEERERLLKELVRSNKELEHFAYIASHDLQEPLRMVSSYVQLISHRYKENLDKDADEFIGYVVSGTAYMQTLLNDLLNYSRVGLRTEIFKLIDLKSALEKALINLKVEVDGSRACITHENLPIVYADEVQMVQVFQNLIANAVKFRGKETPRVQVSAEMKDDEWVVRVKDNGIGIDPKYFDRVFLVFKRLHTRDRYPGTGIGLAICQKIIERHGGRIWVESELGTGATFCFTIPVKSSR